MAYCLPETLNMSAETRAVRDCLKHLYARTIRAYVSYLCLDYECKIGHNDPIPLKCELNISCNLLSIHTITQVHEVGISKSISTTIQKSTGSRDSLYKCMYKIWRIYLIDEVMNAEEGLFLCLPRTPLTGDKIIVILVYLGKMSPSHRGWLQIVLIWTLSLPIVVK